MGVRYEKDRDEPEIGLTQSNRLDRPYGRSNRLDFGKTPSGLGRSLVFVFKEPYQVLFSLVVGLSSLAERQRV